MKRRRWLLWTLFAIATPVVLAGLATFVLWVTLPSVRPLRDDNPKTTAFIELRRSEAEEAGKPFVLRWTWRPLARISPLLRRAVIHAEDIHFFQHEGVDWEAIRKTAEKNWQEGSLARGGSTITQQVAKNLYLSPSRNPIRKVRELFLAWRLEDALSKDRILEIYLNIAEWGPGVFGAEAAARYWFGRSAAELTPAQAARLAVALPNPFRRSPRVRSRALDRKAARLVRAMHRGGLIDDGALDEALRALGQAPTVEAEPPTPEEREERDVPAVAPDPGPPLAEPEPPTPEERQERDAPAVAPDPGPPLVEPEK